MLNRFEKVSIADSEQSERWFLRKSPNASARNTVKIVPDEKEGYAKSYIHRAVNRSHNSDYSLESLFSWKSESNTSQRIARRISDVNTSKVPGKRLSNDSDFKNESDKSSRNTSKSLTPGNFFTL